MSKLIKQFENNRSDYFLGNVLVRVKVVLLSDCSLVLSLLKHSDVRVFLNQKKMRIPNRRNLLNSRIDID